MHKDVSGVAMVCGAGALGGLSWQLDPMYGTGPFAMLMPGILPALWLCHALGLSAGRAAATIALCGVGVAFGHDFSMQRMGWPDALGGADSRVMLCNMLWAVLAGGFAGLGFGVHALGLRRLSVVLAVFTGATALALSACNFVRTMGVVVDPLAEPYRQLDFGYLDVWISLSVGTLSLFAMLFRYGAAAIPLQLAGFGLVSFFAVATLSLLSDFVSGDGLSWGWMVTGWIPSMAPGLVFGFGTYTLRARLTPCGEAVPLDAKPGASRFLLVAGVGGCFAAAWMFAYHTVDLTPWFEYSRNVDVRWQLTGLYLFSLAMLCVLMVLVAGSETLAWQLVFAVPIFMATRATLANYRANPFSPLEVYHVVACVLVILPCAVWIYRWQCQANRNMITVLFRLVGILAMLVIADTLIDLYEVLNRPDIEVHDIYPSMAARKAEELFRVVTRLVHLAILLTLCGLALWPWRKLSSAPPAPRPA